MMKVATCFSLGMALLLGACAGGGISVDSIKANSNSTSIELKGTPKALASCIVPKMDAYPLHAIGGNEQAANMRDYGTRIEILLSPAVVTLTEMPGQLTAMRVDVGRNYWKTKEMVTDLVAFGHECAH